MTDPMQTIKNAYLQVYTTTWCPDCRVLDRWLVANGVPHSKVDIESTEGAAEMLERETGKRAIPFILVNGEHWVRGYHKELSSRFSAEMLIRDLMEAIGHPHA